MTGSEEAGKKGERIRIGVAGVGSLGFHHMRILREMSGVEAVGLFDVDDGRRRQVAEELGVHAFGGLPELIDACDALVVAVPTKRHEEVALQALERGRHLLIEKPIAATLEEADRILAAAERAGVVVQIGHVERFNAAILAAEPYLDHPLFIESHRLAPFANRGTDVAVILDLMIHDVDLVTGLMGGRRLIHFEAAGIPVLTPSVDIANARLSFEGGGIANLTASRVSLERMRKIRIFQPSGYLSLDLADGTGEFLRLRNGSLPGGIARLLADFEGMAAGGPGMEIPPGTAGVPDVSDELHPPTGLQDLIERISFSGDGGEPLRRELESFRDSLSSGTEPVVSGQAGRDALAVALEIEERIRAHVAALAVSRANERR